MEGVSTCSISFLALCKEGIISLNFSRSEERPIHKALETTIVREA